MMIWKTFRDYLMLASPTKPDLIGNAPSLLNEEEETMRHSATSIQPTQTANVSYTAFRQNIALSKPIFDPGNGLMVVGTQEPVHLLSGPQAEIDGHKIVVSRLINNSGSSKESDFGILKPTKHFDIEKNKYSLYLSNILPVDGPVNDLCWLSPCKVALATGSTLTIMQLNTWVRPYNAPIAEVTTEDLLNIKKCDELHSDDIRSVKVKEIDDQYATIATGGFDGS